MVIDVQRTLPDYKYVWFTMFFQHRLLPSASRPPRPRGRATPAPHSSPRCSRRKSGRQRPTRRAGGDERRPPGTGHLFAEKGGDPRERRRSWGRSYNNFKIKNPGKKTTIIQKRIFETRIRIDNQSKLSEIVVTH